MTGRAPTIRAATAEDAPTVTALVAALLDEIMSRTASDPFSVDELSLGRRCRHWLADGRYIALLAVDDGGRALGTATLAETCALYADGAFGIVQECYVIPEARGRRIGRGLLDAATRHGEERGWTRLELCTPPLPEFATSVDFYAANGFAITGGRKMKRALKG